MENLVGVQSVKMDLIGERQMLYADSLAGVVHILIIMDQHGSGPMEARFFSPTWVV